MCEYVHVFSVQRCFIGLTIIEAETVMQIPLASQKMIDALIYRRFKKVITFPIETAFVCKYDEAIASNVDG